MIVASYFYLKKTLVGTAAIYDFMFATSNIFLLAYLETGQQVPAVRVLVATTSCQ